MGHTDVDFGSNCADKEILESRNAGRGAKVQRKTKKIRQTTHSNS